MIGLAGAHRVGKTTLARAYSKQSGIPMIETSSSKTFERLGYSPKEDYDFDTRLFIQTEILKDLLQSYSEVKSGVFISDRTPIDLIAYMLADVQRQTLNKKQEESLAKYVNDCILANNRHFAVVIVVQPGIQMVESADKAPCSIGYIEHLNSLIMGITVSEGISASHFYIPRLMTDLEDRIDCIKFALKKVSLNIGASVENENIH